jgi:uncharacterized membrane protein YeaQ/YmgE (transglycosylase-associated protein family)
MLVVGIFIGLLAAFVLLPLFGVLVWWLISIAITGVVLGCLARIIIPGKQPIGVLATIVSGWVGAIVGGLIGAIILGRHHHRFLTLLIEIGVAAVSVLIWSAASRNSSLETGRSNRVIDA